MGFFFYAITMQATHVVGGEIYYTYLGNDTYELTLKVYRDCGPTNVNGTGFDENASVGIYETYSGDIHIQDFFMYLSSAEVNFVPIVLENPCFILPPDVCVERAIYTEQVVLPSIPGGYTLVYQRCCRNPSIVNLDFPQDQGATFTTHIPGSDELPGANSSAQFTNFPPVALCQNAEFYFDHSATDADGDSLSYEFCSPMTGGSPNQPAPQPPAGPPYFDVNWANGFSASNPITGAPPFAIDPITGFLTGTATELGQFVIGICVSEYRNGVLINTTNRDFQFNVTICDPNIIASIPEQTDFCTGLSIEFTNNSTNATSFQWDFGVPVITTDVSNEANPVYTYPDQGVYTVTLIANPSWPCADTVQTTFTALPVISPVIQYGGYECINGNDFYDFTMTGNVSPNATYQWDFGAGSTPNAASIQSPQAIMMNPEALQMNVTLTVQDNGCEESDTETIDNPPNPVSGIVEQTSFCSGFVYTFENTALNAVDYHWDFGAPGGNDVSAEPTPTYQFLNPGIYEIMLVASAPFACSDTSYMNFEVFGVLDPSYPDQDIQCLETNSYDFTGEGATTATAQYNWDFGPNAIPTTSTQQNPQNVVFNTADTHVVTLTIAENGCEETYVDSVQVSDHFLTQFEIGHSEGCPGLNVQLVGTAISDIPVFYLWDFGDGTTSFQGTTAHTYEYPGNYDVTVTAFTLTGCLDSLTIHYPNAVSVFPNPIPGFTVTPNIVDIEDPEMMIADSSFGGVSCHYIMSDGGIVDDCDFTYNWMQSGMQTITQYVTSEHGCVSRISAGVTIQGFMFYAPNAFTPNGDDLNDFWIPKMIGITEYKLKIFNRWGDLIFASEDKEMPWLGEVHNGDYYAQDGVYNYVVWVRDLLGLPHEFQGHIIVTR